MLELKCILWGHSRICSCPLLPYNDPTVVVVFYLPVYIVTIKWHIVHIIHIRYPHIPLHRRSAVRLDPLYGLGLGNLKLTPG